MEKVIEIIVVWLPIATSIVGSFALIAAVTPNKTDDKVVEVLLKVINFLGANFGNATNEE